MRECICPLCQKDAQIFRNMWDMESLTCKNCGIDWGLDFMPKDMQERLK